MTAPPRNTGVLGPSVTPLYIQLLLTVVQICRAYKTAVLVISVTCHNMVQTTFNFRICDRVRIYSLCGQTRRVISATVVRNIGRISGFVNEMKVISICPARDGYDTMIRIIYYIVCRGGVGSIMIPYEKPQRRPPKICFCLQYNIVEID